MNNKLVLVEARSLDQSKIMTSQKEVVEHLETMTNNDFISLRIQEVVPNVKIVEALSNKFSPTVRLIGHENYIEPKPEKTLVVFTNFTKEGFQTSGFTIGQAIEGYHLTEEFIPLSELSVKNGGLDATNNVVLQPLINPSNGQILLYGERKEPYFRKVDVSKQEDYQPSKFQTANFVAVMEPFSGELKDANNRKTPAYQAWLNSMYLKATENEDAVLADALAKTAEKETLVLN